MHDELESAIAEYLKRANRRFEIAIHRIGYPVPLFAMAA